MRARVVVAAIGMAALCGCGTTAGLHRSTTGGSGTQTDASGGLTSASSVAPGAGGAASSTGVGGGGSGSPVAGGVVGGPGAGATPTGSPSSPTSLPAAGVGVAPHVLTIGIASTANSAAVNSSLGGKGISQGPEQRETAALIDQINKAGGVAGRTLQTVTYTVDAQSPASYTSQAQAECAFFTQDHHVFAVLDSTSAVGQKAKPCLTKAGVPMIRSSLIDDSDQTTADALAVDVHAMSFDRAVTAEVAAFSAQNWFSPWDATAGRAGTASAHVGVVSVDVATEQRAVSTVLLPLLRRAGHAPSPADVIAIPEPGAQGDTGTSVAAISNAILRLRQDGVDHVVLLDSNGALTLFFSNAAFSQHYLPRYGGGTSNGFQALLTGGSIQPSTLAGAVGAGWSPIIDIPFNPSATAPYANAARADCIHTLSNRGITFADANAENVAMGWCDRFKLLAAALRGTTTPSVPTFLSGVAALGSNFADAGLLGARFAADKHDAATSYYAATFVANCTCMRYTGGLQTS